MARLEPPVAPMLARLARELPEGDALYYEPKWDGFRCLAFRSGDDVDLRSRNQRPFARYFPEIVEAIRALGADDAVLDGELLVVRDGRLDFAALMARLHPASSRVELLARETPALFVAFDLLALGDEVVLGAPFAQRRRMLATLLANAPPPIVTSPITSDVAVARSWLRDLLGSGIDGVVVKDAEGFYEPGRRTMTKVKPEHTVDCVVAGFRVLADRPLVASMLLGLYDDATLVHVGVVSSFTDEQRDVLLRELAPHAVPLAGHPWEHGFALEGGPMGRLRGAAGRWTPDLEHDWVPVAPELVCEVAYDQVDGHRFRHPARWRRWRPDRTAASCRVDQLMRPAGEIRSVLA